MISSKKEKLKQIIRTEHNKLVTLCCNKPADKKAIIKQAKHIQSLLAEYRKL